MHRALPLVSLLALACGDPDAGAEPSPDRVEAALPLARPEVAPEQLARSEHEAVALAVRALEEGDLAEANRSILEIPGGAELDRWLLRARLRAAEHDAVGAVQAIETARREWPDQARVYATAAELHAAAGRIDSATEEIRTGLATCGEAPALDRARGVLALSRQGGARLGLQHLIEARGADPGLPFCDLPLTEAHVLLGRQAMAQERALEALGHAKAARIARPDHRDAMELEAEAHQSLGQFGPAIEIYEQLLARGGDLGAAVALTCQRGATAALVEGDRELALQRALRARELGLTDEELGFGAMLIEQEAEAALDRGVEAAAANDLPGASAAFERALRCRPASLEARNHLAVILARSGEPAEAALHWREVLATAAREELELPEPVHLHLARALRAAGRPDEAGDVLRAYLEREPEGRWVADTLAALAQ